MSGDEADPGEHLREELDELHERLAAIAGRVASLESDRDAMYAEAEAQADRMQRAEARIQRLRRSLCKAEARAAASRQDESAATDAAVPPEPE
jgi:outer membrane murein-binding lipoprotein Lpp